MSANPRPTAALSVPERVNFLLTNRLPRRWLTLFMGRFSKLENPLVRSVSMGIWQAFVDDLRLEEAERSDFRSLHDCFTRRLKPDARPIDPDPTVLVSPCDAVLGEFGELCGLEAIQAKGFPYTIDELLGSPAAAERYRDGRFVTLRLKSSMYHRFHAPDAGRIEEITYISGDTWNVNPVALKVVERLFCRNERVVFPLRLDRNGGGGEGPVITLVAVAAILVASVRVQGLEAPLNLEYRGPNRMTCNLAVRRGQEIGYFEHGSTIVLLLPRALDFAPGLVRGEVIRMGRPLLRRTAA